MEYLMNVWPVTTVVTGFMLIVIVAMLVQRQVLLRSIAKGCDGWVNTADEVLTLQGFKEGSITPTYFPLTWIDCMPSSNERIFSRFREKGYFIFVIVSGHEASLQFVDPEHTHIMFYGCGKNYTTFKPRMEN